MRLSVIVLAVLAIAQTCRGDQQDNAKNKPSTVPPAVAPFLKGTADDFMRRFDRNRDGVLTKDELPRGLKRLFDRADTNGDGKLDKGEVQEMLENLRQRFNVQRETPDKPQVERIGESFSSANGHQQGWED